ncbi:uncharacterized protein LOC120330211 [Styela clava]
MKKRLIFILCVIVSTNAYHHYNDARRMPMEDAIEQQVDRYCDCNVAKYNDPLWKDTWYLQTKTSLSMRINEAWERGLTGKGVVISVLNDGIEQSHPDLSLNYDSMASYDFIDGKAEPTPRVTSDNANRLGTRMAGLISGNFNDSVCSVGVAHKSSIGGIRLHVDKQDDKMEAQAFGFANNHIDIYAGAFGPQDDGLAIAGPGPEAQKAIERAVKEGRNGKGNIFVWSTGNGNNTDDCNSDGYANSIYTIAVGSISSDGKKAWFGEKCSSMLAVTYGGGTSLHKNMATTSLGHGCTTKQTGSSASVSMAAGICALALEANPNLTWRDMQHLIVNTANPSGLESDDWITNAADRTVSRTFGFGMMDANAMVTRAKDWIPVPPQTSCRIIITNSNNWSVNRRPRSIQLPAYPCEDDGVIPDRLEHVGLMISTYKSRDISHFTFYLDSPSRTRSKLLANRLRDDRYNVYKRWNFTSVQFWDENPVGDWVFTMEHDAYSTVISPMVLTLYGTLEKDWETTLTREPIQYEEPAEESNTNQIQQSCDCDIQDFNDPFWKDAWHLRDQTNPSMNIKEAWNEGFTGEGVVVSVISDGLDHAHPDIIKNYDPAASYDFNNDDSDPTPRPVPGDANNVGTQLAGLISATANNDVCSVGVAPKARIGGIRLLDGEVSDNLESRAFGFANNHVDIYMGAYGPVDDGFAIGGPGPETQMAIEKAIREGRDGKGNIFVWSTGNGGKNNDDCNCDGYSNSIYTIGIGSISSDSEKAWYGERCSSMMAVTYSSGTPLHWSMATTKPNGECTSEFKGNGGSVAVAAGICALALEANPDLTWRDMQHLIVETASRRGLISDDWRINAAGRNISRTFGFGLMDAHAMVKKARDWVLVPRQVSCRITLRRDGGWSMNVRWPKIVQIPTSVCENGGRIPDRLEHVTIMISTYITQNLGDIKMYLESPSRTKFPILAQRVWGSSRISYGYKNWVFTSILFWDENPVGDWIARFERDSYATIRSPMVLTLYGTLEEDWEKLQKEDTTEAPVVESTTTEETKPVTNTNPEDLKQEQRQKLFRDFRYLACKTSCNIQALVDSDYLCSCTY